jgi:hypothetical protein
MRMMEGNLSGTCQTQLGRRDLTGHSHTRETMPNDIYRHEVMREPARKYGLNMMYERGGVW